MRKLYIRIWQFPIRLYRAAISPLAGSCCRYHPTCSAYALEALERHGVLKGMVLALRRIMSCHPWSRRTDFIDPVPERAFAWGDLFRYNRRHQPQTTQQDETS